MKKYVFIFLLSAPYLSYSQNIEIKNGSFVFERVETIDSLNAEEIYKTSQEWTARNFRNTDKVVQAEIPNKLIRINGVSSNIINTTFHVLSLEYLILLEFKDNKVRVSVNNFKLITRGTNMTLEYACLKKNGKFREGQVYHKYYNNSNENIKSLMQHYINSLKGLNGDSDTW